MLRCPKRDTLTVRTPLTNHTQPKGDAGGKGELQLSSTVSAGGAAREREKKNSRADDEEETNRQVLGDRLGGKW